MEPSCSSFNQQLWDVIPDADPHFPLARIYRACRGEDAPEVARFDEIAALVEQCLAPNASEPEEAGQQRLLAFSFRRFLDLRNQRLAQRSWGAQLWSYFLCAIFGVNRALARIEARTNELMPMSAEQRKHLAELLKRAWKAEKAEEILKRADQYLTATRTEDLTAASFDVEVRNLREYVGDPWLEELPHWVRFAFCSRFKGEERFFPWMGALVSESELPASDLFPLFFNPQGVNARSPLLSFSTEHQRERNGLLKKFGRSLAQCADVQGDWRPFCEWLETQYYADWAEDLPRILEAATHEGVLHAKKAVEVARYAAELYSSSCIEEFLGKLGTAPAKNLLAEWPEDKVDVLWILFQLIGGEGNALPSQEVCAPIVQACLSDESDVDRQKVGEFLENFKKVFHQLVEGYQHSPQTSEADAEVQANAELLRVVQSFSTSTFPELNSHFADWRELFAHSRLERVGVSAGLGGLLLGATPEERKQWIESWQAFCYYYQPPRDPEQRAYYDTLFAIMRYAGKELWNVATFWKNAFHDDQKQAQALANRVAKMPKEQIGNYCNMLEQLYSPGLSLVLAIERASTFDGMFYGDIALGVAKELELDHDICFWKEKYDERLNALPPIAELVAGTAADDRQPHLSWILSVLYKHDLSVSNAFVSSREWKKLQKLGPAEFSEFCKKAADFEAMCRIFGGEASVRLYIGVSECPLIRDSFGRILKPFLLPNPTEEQEKWIQEEKGRLVEAVLKGFELEEQASRQYFTSLAALSQDENLQAHYLNAGLPEALRMQAAVGLTTHEKWLGWTKTCSRILVESFQWRLFCKLLPIWQGDDGPQVEQFWRSGVGVWNSKDMENFSKELDRCPEAERRAQCLAKIPPAATLARY